MVDFICGFKVRVQGKTYKVVCDNIGDAINVITEECNVTIKEIDSINPWCEKIYGVQPIRKKEKRTVTA